MSKTSITGADARAEISRRANNKRTGSYEPAANAEVMRLTGAELRTLDAGDPPTPAPVKTAAKVSAKAAKAQAQASLLRKQAWTMRQAGEGTYRECLARIGGTPAKG